MCVRVRVFLLVWVWKGRQWELVIDQELAQGSRIKKHNFLAVQYRFLFWSYFSAIRRPGDIVLESSLDFVCSCCIL